MVDYSKWNNTELIETEDFLIMVIPKPQKKEEDLFLKEINKDKHKGIREELVRDVKKRLQKEDRFSKLGAPSRYVTEKMRRAIEGCYNKEHIREALFMEIPNAKKDKGKQNMIEKWATLLSGK